MLRFLTDEDFNNRILRGLLRRLPSLDIVRVQDVDLMGRHDTKILEWAANEERILLTHDAETMIEFAKARVKDRLSMKGVIEIPQDLQIGIVIEQLVLIAECSLENEWDNQVIFIPLKN